MNFLFGKSGRWGHRPRRIAAVRVPQTAYMVNENYIFRQLLRTKARKYYVHINNFSGVTMIFFYFN